MPLVHLNIGSNQGDRKGFIDRAVALISVMAGPVVGRSEWIESPPWGYESSSPFINIGINIETELSPLELLAAVKAVEQQVSPGSCHRNSDGSYRDRDIDIDIIDYEGVCMSTDELIIPHRHMRDRSFVMEPYLLLWPHKTV